MDESRVNDRALSWLAFNDRVLQEAGDPDVPLLQRLRFLGIFSNNEDEFVRVRLADLMWRTDPAGRGGKSKRTPGDDTVALVRDRMAASRGVFADIYASLLEEMAAQDIRVLDERSLSPEQERFCRDYFSRVVSARLVPLLLRKSASFSTLEDSNLYHAVRMSGKKGKNVRYAILQIPMGSQCPRFIVMPSVPGTTDIVFLDDVIRLCLDEIFFMFGHESIEAWSFKVVRDAELEMESDVSKSLMEKVERSIRARDFGRPVRLTYDRAMPDDVLSLLRCKLRLTAGTVLDAGGRYHRLRDLMQFPSVRPELEERKLTPVPHPRIGSVCSFFKTIAKGDLFLHYPYHDFKHTIDFLREAAIDPRVESIFISLYRTAPRSKVINALVNAARNGKIVHVIMELRARFDEEQNIEYAALLQESGVSVIDGVPGLKVHGKVILVERRQAGKLKGFGYVGTGNFNEDTARLYSDFGLFTARADVIDDLRALFRTTVLHQAPQSRRLLVAPYDMRERFVRLIDREVKAAGAGKPAAIWAKFNSLTDPAMIERLYRASGAGVDVRLIVRSTCCLRPEVSGLSENIRVISIVDRYLEHARMVVFHNNGSPLVYILSADWMTRNLNRRVEVAAPVDDPKVVRALLDVFDLQWRDTVKARSLAHTDFNAYVDGSDEGLRSQMALYDYYRRKAELEGDSQ